MPPHRFGFAVAVYGLLVERDRMLFMRRAGSGYRDGQLGLPSGHLEGGEDALSGLVRELHEELAIEVDPAACRLALVMHRAPEEAGDQEYLDLFFTVAQWAGEPVIAERDKCSELAWLDPAALPADAVDYVGVALAAIARGEPLVLHGW